jgi:hypothetical protein
MRGVGAPTPILLVVIILPNICVTDGAKTVKRFAGWDDIDGLRSDLWNRPHFSKGERGDIGVPGVKGDRGDCICRSTHVFPNVDELEDEERAKDGDFAIVGTDELWLKFGKLWMKLAIVDTRPSAT